MILELVDSKHASGKTVPRQFPQSRGQGRGNRGRGSQKHDTHNTTSPFLSDDDLASTDPVKKKRVTIALLVSTPRDKPDKPAQTVSNMGLISDSAPPFTEHRRTSTVILNRCENDTSTLSSARRVIDAPTPLPTRSRGPPTTLSRPCCLRCSKRIVVDPDHVCDVKPNVRCSYCSIEVS